MHSAACVRCCCRSSFWRSQTSSCLWKKTLPSERRAVIWSPERRTRMVTLQVSSRPQLSTTRRHLRSRTSSSTKASTTVAFSGGVPVSSGELSGRSPPPCVRTPRTRHSRARSVSSQAAACCCCTLFRLCALRAFSGGAPAASSAGALRLPKSGRLPPPPPPPLPWPLPAASRSRATMGMVPLLHGPRIAGSSAAAPASFWAADAADAACVRRVTSSFCRRSARA
mmetsp:Transcript_106743/g.344436  ORF Transcript_106743/g.344436 Transcript_106743/m.344436 type:complete len:225 (-) Transcript_106743:2127-2801(-)